MKGSKRELKNTMKKTFRIPCKMVLAGFGLAGLWWGMEAIIMVAVFQEGSLAEQILLPDWHEAWMRLSTACVLLGFGVYAQITLSRRERMERERQEIEARLQVAARLAAVGELAAGVAHELNNPLAVMQGYAELLATREDLDETMRSDVERIFKEAKRATRITANMISFAGKREPAVNRVCINSIVERALDQHAWQMKVSNIGVLTDLSPDLPEAMADFYQLQQVFVNLIANAENAMTEANGRGTLTIKTRQVNGAIRVAMTDDGPGIAKDTLDKIFDPFFTTKEVGKGTGLGLSSCYGILEQHGGTIRAESRLGEGATFVVEIPIAFEDRASVNQDFCREHFESAAHGERDNVL